MLTVSKDKEWIFNFNNTTSVGIDKCNETYELKIISVAGKWNELGKYRTKERAKEVLQEIVDEYEIEQRMKYYIEFIRCLNLDRNYRFVYEMPEE